jgi:hypothetical protein
MYQFSAKPGALLVNHNEDAQLLELSCITFTFISDSDTQEKAGVGWRTLTDV